MPFIHIHDCFASQSNRLKSKTSTEVQRRVAGIPTFLSNGGGKVIIDRSHLNSAKRLLALQAIEDVYFLLASGESL